MKISVIIPSFNQGRYLDAAIRSVLRQDLRPHEILLMDGGSTDGSLEIIKRYESRLTFWRSRPDGGQAAAVNEGISRATGDWISWVNSDDGLTPGALSAVQQAGITSGSNFVTGASYWTTEDLSQIHYYPALRGVTLQDFRDGTTPITQPSTFFPRKMWSDLGGLNESFHYALDYDFFLRALKAGYRVKSIAKPLAFNRIHASTKTASGNLRVETAGVCKQYFGNDARIDYTTYFEKFGYSLLYRFPLSFLIGCILKTSQRRSSHLPGLPLRRDAAAAEALRAFVTEGDTAET